MTMKKKIKLNKTLNKNDLDCIRLNLYKITIAIQKQKELLNLSI